MAEHVLANLAVIVDDQRHWYAVAERKEHGHKQLVIKRFAQIVEAARCQESLCECNNLAAFMDIWCSIGSNDLWCTKQFEVC